MIVNLQSQFEKNGVLAHPVERNTGSVEVSSSSLLYSTNQKLTRPNELSINNHSVRFFVHFSLLCYQFVTILFLTSKQ